jgi:glutaredoxin
MLALTARALTARAPAAAAAGASARRAALRPARSAAPAPLRHATHAAVLPPARRAAASAAAAASGGGEDYAAMIAAKNADNPVMVYATSTCPYCAKVKALLGDLGVPFKAVDFDSLADGAAMRAAVNAVSGMRTVPQVFVGGALVGGCDDTVAAARSGDLKRRLAAAGVVVEG